MNWSIFCRELGGKILEYKNKREELKEVLKETVGKYGCFETNLKLVEKNGMEPFTFWACALTVSESKRKEMFGFWQKKFGVDAQVPENFDGMPNINQTKAGFFGDIDLLWSLYEAAYKYPEVNEDEFAEKINNACKLNNVKIAKITEVFFIINSKYLFSCDGTMLSYLKEKGVSIPTTKKGNLKKENINGEKYIKLLDEVKKAGLGDYIEISQASYNFAKKAKEEEKTKTQQQTIIQGLKEIKSGTPKEWQALKDKNNNEYPHNRVIFGAPGTGKSNLLKTETEGMDKKYVTRVTFHPDYSYAHFVGCYKPCMVGEQIRYEFIAGPFLEVYKKAKKDPDNHYVLIIEEINRANVAAVFGDVFQLLDRKDDGESEYPIATSKDIKDWLTDNGVTDAEQMCIPNNMYIWATMNSADQGVYPMDTAFKRRWTFEYLDINYGADKASTWEVTIGGKKYNWDKLRRKINHTLLNANVNEDKCLGPFFIKDGVNAEEFASKVLMYLYEDVVKQKPSRIFNAELKGFSSIYNKSIDKCELKDIFVKDIYEDFIDNANGNGANG